MPPRRTAAPSHEGRRSRGTTRRPRAAWKDALDELLDAVPARGPRSAAQATAAANQAVERIRRAYSTSCTIKSKLSTLKKEYAAARPDDVSTATALRPSAVETRDCKRRQRESVESRSDALRRVDGGKLLREARATLAAPREAPNKYVLALALLAVTGRRTAEILNRRSAFRAVPQRPYVALFSGQLKKKTDRAAAAYRIPLLAKRTDVIAALRELRSRQQQDVAQLSNKAVSRRYQSELGKYLHRCPAYAQAGWVHNLRGVYAIMCYHSIDWKVDAKPLLLLAVTRFLGNEAQHRAIAYTTFDVHNIGGATLKPRRAPP